MTTAFMRRGSLFSSASPRALADDVVVVAPEYDQSGVAHSLSLNDPLRLRKISERRFAVKGTPTDCVIMAVRSIMQGRKPDLVLSGVNRGQNVADDITYSGTIAGAMEGTMLGIPSIALSQCYGASGGHELLDWDCAEVHAPELIRALLAEGIDRDILINVNFPAAARERSPASRSRSKAGAIFKWCGSSRARTGAAIPITGSPSTATSPSRRRAPISTRFSTSAFR